MMHGTTMKIKYHFVLDSGWNSNPIIIAGFNMGYCNIKWLFLHVLNPIGPFQLLDAT
jgi:hypothetical protein